MDSHLHERFAEFTARRLGIFYPKTDLQVADSVLENLRNQSDSDFGLTQQVLEAVATAAFPGARPAIQRLERQGTFHRLYLAELPNQTRYVLRFNVTGSWWGGCTLQLENWVANRARSAGIPTPEILLTDISRRVCPLDYQITGYAPDKSLQDYDADEPALQRLLIPLGAVFARLHGLAVRRFGWLDARPLFAEPPAEPTGLFAEWRDYITVKLDAHVEDCLKLGAIAAPTARRILDHFSHIVPQISGFQPVLLHGDPGNHNVTTNGRDITALLDWEDCLAGDPVYEIAFWATFHPERRHTAFLEGYRSVCPLPEDFEVRFWLYFLRISLAKTVHRHRFGYQDRPGRPPASQRIQTALDRLEAVLVSHP